MKALYNEHWKARKIEVVQLEPGLFNAEIELFSKDEEKVLVCEGSRDVNSLLEVFYSYRIEIEEHADAQLEFGRYSLCFTSDSYFEIEFDNIYEKNA